MWRLVGQAPEFATYRRDSNLYMSAGACSGYHPPEMANESRLRSTAVKTAGKHVKSHPRADLINAGFGLVLTLMLALPVVAALSMYA